MDWLDIYVALRSVWTVWFTLLFVGIVAWAFWPSNKAKLEDRALIPLRDE